MIVIKKDGKYGMMGTDNQMILEPQYEGIKPFAKQDVFVVKESGTWKVIGKEKDVITDTYDDYTALNGDAFIVRNGNAYGTYNILLGEQIPVEYESLRYAYGDFYLAKKDGAYGVIQTNKEVKIAVSYKTIAYREDIAIFEGETEENTYDIYNKSMQKITTGMISDVDVDSGYIKIREADKYQYYNLALEPKKASEVLANHKLFLDKKDGKYGYVNANGEVFVDYLYDDATEFNAYGFASVKQNQVWGSVNEEGKTVTEPKYNLDENVKIDFIGKWHVSNLYLNLNYYTDK